MSVRINLGAWGSVFAVPSCVVDEHLKLASPSQVKIILFLLRHSGSDFTYKEIGDALFIHEDDVRDSISFWVDRGILSEVNGELVPTQVSENITEEKPIVKEEQETKPKTKHVVSKPKRPDVITVAQRVSADPDLRHTLEEVEIALAKPLSNADSATIVMLYDTLGLPPGVIVMLVNYCVSVGKGNIRAIEKLGIEWSDAGVNDIKAADNRIMLAKQSTNNWNRVSTVFGMKNIGSPTSKQLGYVDRWVGEWHFSDEMLRAAYEACVDNTNKFSMAYINKILQRWYNAEIFTVHDISKLEKKKPEKKSTPHSSFDIDELDIIK